MWFKQHETKAYSRLNECVVLCWQRVCKHVRIVQHVRACCKLDLSSRLDLAVLCIPAYVTLIR